MKIVKKIQPKIVIFTAVKNPCMLHGRVFVMASSREHRSLELQTRSDTNKPARLQKHHDNMSVCFIPHYTPLLYSKTGVYRGIHYFLIFALKHRLWVLVRIASLRRF